jgi:1-pyrroline-5-carboxylate dehydrogenase
MNRFLLKAQPRMTLFTGSGRVAEKLARDLAGKIKIEDAGFDWKVLGPDVPASKQMQEYVAWVADQDAYACSGQKCSAQSVVFAHSNWIKAGFIDKIGALASRRRLDDLTIGPVLTWTTEAMLGHVKKLLAIPGAKLLFGGKELSKHSIPKVYGAIEPTAVFVPLHEMIKPGNYEVATTEVFGPLQVITEWKDGESKVVLDSINRMSHFLTAGVVSNDPVFM